MLSFRGVVSRADISPNARCALATRGIQAEHQIPILWMQEFESLPTFLTLQSIELTALWRQNIQNFNIFSAWRHFCQRINLPLIHCREALQTAAGRPPGGTHPNRPQRPLRTFCSSCLSPLLRDGPISRRHLATLERAGRMRRRAGRGRRPC